MIGVTRFIVSHQCLKLNTCWSDAGQFRHTGHSLYNLISEMSKLSVKELSIWQVVQGHENTAVQMSLSQ